MVQKFKWSSKKVEITESGEFIEVEQEQVKKEEEKVPQENGDVKEVVDDLVEKVEKIEKIEKIENIENIEKFVKIDEPGLTSTPIKKVTMDVSKNIMEEANGLSNDDFDGNGVLKEVCCIFEILGRFVIACWRR